MKTTKHAGAVALGRKSWAKRRKNPKHKEQLSKAGKAGAAKTNAIKAAKRKLRAELFDKVKNEQGVKLEKAMKKVLREQLDGVTIPKRTASNA